MLMADGSSNFWSSGDFACGDDFPVDDDDIDLSMDMESFLSILAEKPDPLQSSPEDNSFKNASQCESASNVGNYDSILHKNGTHVFEGAPSLGAELGGSLTSFPSHNSEASDSRMGGSDVYFEPAGNSDFGRKEIQAQIVSPVHSCSGSLTDWISRVPGQETCTERVGVPQNVPSCSRFDNAERQYETPNLGTVFSFAAGDTDNLFNYPDNLDLNHMEDGTEIQFRPWDGDIDSKYISHNPLMVNQDLTLGHYGIFGENNIENLGTSKENLCTPMGISLYNTTRTEPRPCQVPEVLCQTSDQFSAFQLCMNTDAMPFTDYSRHCLPNDITLQVLPSNGVMRSSVNDERDEFSTENACLNRKMISDAMAGTCIYAPEVPVIDYPDVKEFNYEDSDYSSPFSGNSFSHDSDRSVDDKSSLQPSSYTGSLKQEVIIKHERNDKLFTPKSSIEVANEVASRKFSSGADYRSVTNKDLKSSLPGVSHSVLSKKHAIHINDEDVSFASKRVHRSQDINTEAASRNIANGRRLDVHASEQLSSCVQPSTSIRKMLGCINDGVEAKLIQPKCMTSYISKVSPESIQCHSSDYKSHVDDDPDIYILEDISVPPRSNFSSVQVKSFVPLQRSTYGDPLFHTGAGGMRLKANDERSVLVAALQDFSQPKSEASPPDGFLAVPLLRHQRIALSWMVQKETASMQCSGGILADDQGLGKTISTIALILKERSPSSNACTKDNEGELETLNLDEDDDVSELDEMKSRDALQAKGRPAAGTLVVCPTSVLRQWAEELQNKVTSRANLSVLVYHGSNRTKDPGELAKYDVVLTTYSIVSMEVPKQPLVDKDDDEKKPETHNVPPMGLSSSKKRKYPPSSDKRGLKDKKGADGALLESARPLARVGWFRVVLDEAQSIKNHRTQVARACWGLRAKRRWCLSGTPIQNAVDDLYSYFRFLRFDPYASYKLFCSTIKVPINRNPVVGYRKLQAVLRTIMLRRTKGSLLDGEPIITLPPKSVELKRVDFSKEERDFYSRLEADSRAQFEVYAAAGTVKQNYVNILLMLLRLRQACDHPLLVKGYDSNSVWRSSVETAKKLPREKQICLLNCLEASLAICGICNDPPEDAVVSTCGHVFCNQCICEHLTGDDNQCPTTNCKVRLNVSSVFSKEALKSSLSDQSVQGSSPDGSGSGSEVVGALEPCSEVRSFDSSKIKAALEVLQSLSKPGDCITRTSSLESLSVPSLKPCNGTADPENTSDTHSGEVLNDGPARRDLVENKGSNGSIGVLGEKAIVFSQWTRMLDLLEACLKDSSIQYRRLDGTMSVMARDKAVKDFNTRPEVSVMIMSLKAASLGLNMVAACHVLLLDLWWNPTTEDQAIDRAHRIGQTRPVTVLRLTVKDTVEDRILALQQKKREMVSSAFGEDESGGRQSRLTEKDLQYLFNG